jgi:hypothetical protein
MHYSVTTASLLRPLYNCHSPALLGLFTCMNRCKLSVHSCISMSLYLHYYVSLHALVGLFKRIVGPITHMRRFLYTPSYVSLHTHYTLSLGPRLEQASECSTQGLQKKRTKKSTRSPLAFSFLFFFNPCLLSSLCPPSFWLPPVGAARFLLLLPYPASGCTNAYILVTSCISRHEFFFYSGIPIVRGMEGSLIVTIMSTNGTPAIAAWKRSGTQLLKCQYLYFCTSKASNASTWAHVEDRAH